MLGLRSPLQVESFIMPSVDLPVSIYPAYELNVYYYDAYLLPS